MANRILHGPRARGYFTVSFKYQMQHFNTKIATWAPHSDAAISQTLPRL